MSFFRNAIWFVKGLSEYTKSGYASASKHFNAADLQVSCSGKSYMITGANSGIGKIAAIEIAKRGGVVHMVCRSRERGEEAKSEITTATNNQEIHLHILDMSQPQAVVQFVKSFTASGQGLNVLINNAGCMVNKREVNEDGLETNFATNTLGTHLLTVGLVPLLLKSDKPRVVVVSSGGMLVQKLNLADLQSEKMNPFDGTMVYAQNKRQQVIMTQQYSKMWPAIHFSSMHPGWADTPAVRSSMPDFYEKMKDRLRTAEEGADTMVWLALSDAALSTKSGSFFQDRKPAATHLPLAWTTSKDQEEKEFMNQLKVLSDKYSS